MTGGLLDKALDLTVAFSFDKSGFLRHQRRFRAEDLAVDLLGRTCLVTGASSGLGLAASEALAGLGAEVLLLCRDRARGEAAVDRIRARHPDARLRLALADVSSLDSLAAFLATERLDRLDVLVNNAGVLPLQREVTPERYELTWATNVLGPFALTWGLLPALRRSPAPRVITVTSGGMYPVRLDLDDWSWTRRPFDGVRAYAETKRAEVILNELWAERLAPARSTPPVVFTAMHPGWAETPGVARSLPGFNKLMQGRLRSPEEGADTIVWLAAAERAGRLEASGKLFFDREEVRTHALPWTRESPATRSLLWELLTQQARPALGDAPLP
jgi:dehydrogenase/reductase SDR family protein 12